MSATDHFKTGLRALKRQRDDLDRMIAEAERMITDMEKFEGLAAQRSGASSAAASSAGSPAQNVVTGEPTIMSVLTEKMEPRRPYHFRQIMALLRDGGVSAAEDSVRGVLYKQAKKGRLGKGKAPASFYLPDENGRGPSLGGGGLGVLDLEGGDSDEGASVAS